MYAVLRYEGLKVQGFALETRHVGLAERTFHLNSSSCLIPLQQTTPGCIFVILAYKNGQFEYPKTQPAKRGNGGNGGRHAAVAVAVLGNPAAYSPPKHTQHP